MHRRSGVQRLLGGALGPAIPAERRDRGRTSPLELRLLIGTVGKRELADIDAYVARINAQRKQSDLDILPWTRNDVVAMTCLLGARFGAGGGDRHAGPSC